MNSAAPILQLLKRTAARQRLQRGWHGFWTGLFAGVVACSALIALYKLCPLPKELLRWAWIPIVFFPLLGFLIRWARSISEQEAARWLDQQQGLQERLSTALEMQGNQKAGTWRELILSDAIRTAGGVDPRKILPWRMPPVWKWVAVGAAAAVGLGFVPEYRTKAYQQGKKDAQVIKEVGQQLAGLTRRTLDQRKPALEQNQKSLESVAELGDRLQQAKLTRNDALKDIASVTEKLKQDVSEMARSPALRRLEQAARTPGNATKESAGSLQKQMEALQKQLGDQAGKNGEAMNQLQKDLQALKDAAKGLADKDGAKGAEARGDLAKMAAELARKAESMGMPLPSLDEAVAALNAAQVEQFLRDLNTADQDLKKMADLSRQLAQMQQQAEKIGKDLAEQLRNGQAQAAIETLQKMRELLAKAGLTPEQLKKLTRELTDALKPAEQYGDVAKFLKEAAERAGQDRKNDGEKALAAAQKELEKLLGELGDMQGMMAALQNMQKAQMAIGNGMGWGESQSLLGGAGGSGKPKGKGRRGFGDWSDEDPWAMPGEISEAWDNSGLTRGDKDSKGLTERDSGTPNNLAPTKVKGQIQPGGPMPSITLRGVSIKGSSSVAYSEAVAAAQSDAQAALSQDKVPRAYQNAVRSYFDDLKK